MGFTSDERLEAVEPRLRGELGYADWCLWLIEAGHCSCDGCGGHLEDELCISSGCRHQVQEATRFHGRHPVWRPVYERGRCLAADARTEEQLREQAQLAVRQRRKE